MPCRINTTKDTTTTVASSRIGLGYHASGVADFPQSSAAGISAICHEPNESPRLSKGITRARSTTVLRNIINAAVFPLHRTGKLEEELSDMYDLSKVSESVEASLKSSRRRMFRRWRGFADGLRTQWHMISFVAAVFIGTLATMLQDPFVSESPLALAAAAVSLLCALSSLLYGVILHVHLSKIKSWEATIMWLKNVQRLQTQSLVNPIKLLVSPLAWLLCSAAFFILALFLAYVWAPDLGETIVRRHPVLRAAVACVFLAWTVQGPVAFWTLRQLRRRPLPDTLA